MRLLPITIAILLPAAAAAQGANTADYSFSYTYPAAVRAYPPLRAWFDADSAHARAQTARDAANGRREARKSGYPFHAYEDQTEWKVVTDTPRLLSLSGTHYTFTGGAHGGTNTLSQVWDKAGRRRLAATDLFASPAAIQQALGASFCTALDRERAKRRGAPVKRSGDMFNNCPKVSETVVLLGSTNRRTIDRIGLVADQYVAGPYAEGAYEVTLPVTPAVIAVVKPAWRGVFSVRR